MTDPADLTKEIEVLRRLFHEQEQQGNVSVADKIAQTLIRACKEFDLRACRHGYYVHRDKLTHLGSLVFEAMVGEFQDIPDYSERVGRAREKITDIMRMIVNDEDLLEPGTKLLSYEVVDDTV